MIRCAGSSSKFGGEGGSFGIGKNAPFAASQLRTVLYSNMNIDGRHAFQGVSTLVSHKLTDGATAQPTGFLGGDRGESIRASAKIPKKFRRTEPGIDIIALEYPRAPWWESDLLCSIVEHFWPAIDFGDLVVTVGDRTIDEGEDQIIDKTNLAGFLDAFSMRADFSAHLFYKAYKTPSLVFHEHLPNLKETSLYFYTDDVDLPKRVAMIRKTGMVIFLRGHLRSILPFCGVFLCRNETGNMLLREMEPPRHDTWDPDHPERGINKNTEVEYMNFIKDCIKKLVQIDDSKVISIPGLNRFLPDDDDTPEEAFDAGESTSKGETPDRSPLPEKIDGRKIDSQHRRMQPDKSKPEGEEDETEAGEGEGTGGGPGTNTNETDGGQGSGGGGKGDGNAGPETGGKGGDRSKPAVPVRYRTFATNAEEGSYTVMVAAQGNSNHTVNLLVSTVGDDDKAPAEIRCVRLADGQSIPVVGVGIFGPVQLAGGQTLRLQVVLSEPLRVAMEVTAHEA